MKGYVDPSFLKSVLPLVRGHARVLNEPGLGASIENTAALCILWARLIQADESLARTAGQVEAFCHLLRQRQGYRLRGWLEEVEQHGEPELQACAHNLHKEESAVQARPTLAWSNGPTEGFIHRLKLLKRQAYGRAGVALLKQRMLFHPSDPTFRLTLMTNRPISEKTQDRRSGWRGFLLLFLFYAHGLGWSSRDPRETAATQPSSWASPMSSPSGPRR